MLPGMPEGQLNGLMQPECRAWDGRLERLEADLAELIRFLGRPGRVVALDTSALMEGVFFTEFDWHGRDGPLREQPIRLVVLSLVTEELDELKRHRDGRRRAQARKVLTTLWDLHRARPASPAALPKYADVTIEVLLDGGWHQRMPNNDGEIIDQAVGLKEQTGQEVILAAETTHSYTGPRRPG